MQHTASVFPNEDIRIHLFSGKTSCEMPGEVYKSVSMWSQI